MRRAEPEAGSLARMIHEGPVRTSRSNGGDESCTRLGDDIQIDSLSGGMEGRLAKADLRRWVGGPVEEVQRRPGGTRPSRGRPFVNHPG